MQKAVKMEQCPCVHVLASVKLCLLLVYYPAVVKANSLKLLYLKTWKEECFYKDKWKSKIGTQWLFVEIATLKRLNAS